MRKSGIHFFASGSPRRTLFALLGLAGLFALWQMGFLLGGPFVVPAPGETFLLVIDLIGKGAIWQPALITACDVLIGYAAGCLAGLLFGLAGGAAADIAAALEPVATIILGIPPIAWVVLALLWFGPQGMAPAFTVAIGIAPIVFAAAIAGARAAKPELDELATAYHAPPWQRLVEIRLPQMAVSLVPALATALGLAWKMALMAEVLGGGQGIGGRLADARSHLDMAETMAWILIALGLLLATDRLLARAAACLPVVSR